MTFDLTPIAATVKSAVEAEGTAHGRWVKASDAAWSLGVRADMLSSDKDKGDKDVKTQFRGLIHAAFTPKVQTLLAVPGSAVVGLTDQERSDRRYWKQRTEVMLGRLAHYLRQHERDERGAQATRRDMAQRLKDDCELWQSRIRKADEKAVECFDDVSDVIKALKDVIDLC
jgi:hypothetical protein